jgi:hypothetical protein
MKIKVWFVEFAKKRGVVTSYAWVVEIEFLWYKRQVCLSITPFDLKHPQCLSWGKPNFDLQSLIEAHAARPVNEIGSSAFHDNRVMMLFRSAGE